MINLIIPKKRTIQKGEEVNVLHNYALLGFIGLNIFVSQNKQSYYYNNIHRVDLSGLNLKLEVFKTGVY